MATIDVKDAAGSTVALERPLTPGTAADSASRPVAFSTEGKAQLGAVGETAPASDTASSGLNGRLQRIAQRLTTLLPASLTVKAASTAPVAADPALVVAMSPNSVNANGQATMANSAPVVLASNQSAVTTSNTTLTDFGAGEYEAVAASQTDQILGATGAVGDYLAGVLIVPATTSPGAVSIKDGNGSAITIFTGGASSVAALVPFFVPLGIKCLNATTPGWKVTTGANVSALGTGNFT